jgi:thiamine transport system substrate-binding protein
VKSHRTPALAVLLAIPLAGCGDDGGGAAESITLVAYDSFPTADTSLNAALAAFTEDTGVDVELVIAGDAGTMVSKAVLTAGNPEGDVMFGVDNTFLSRVVDGEVFESYTADGLDTVPDELRALVPDDEATPVDFGDVCINYDIAWFEEHELDPPTDLAALAEPQYRDLLVVENPATSSPGLAFLMASVAEFGEDGWHDYWSRLADNGVEVVAGWEEAYYERFTWAGGGPKPLVVSYGTSPPAEVLFADPPVTEAPTAVVESTCFRQVEFAGVLRGTDAPDEAEKLVDFLISERFQAELPLNLFVYPANGDVPLPPEFTEYAVQPDDPATLDPSTIAANRESWIDQWTDLVLR